MLNYNGLRYLKRTIQPILDLDYPNFEFIVVDNGSTDGSIEFVQKFKNIRLIMSPKIGEKNFACNYAISRAMGEYILLLDNDIIVQEREILSNLILNYSNLHKAGTITLAYMDDGEELSKGYGGYFGYYFSYENPYLTSRQISKMNNIVVGCPAGIGLFIKYSLWKELGGYDEDLKFGGDDNDLGIRICLKGLKNYLYSKTLQIHIGNINKKKSNDDYRLRWQLLVQSYLHTITKNYRLCNLSIALVVFSIFAVVKSIKQSIFRLHPGPFLSLFHGYYLFLRMLPATLKKRKEIQLMRTEKKDQFLQIRPPKSE